QGCCPAYGIAAVIQQAQVSDLDLVEVERVRRNILEQHDIALLRAGRIEALDTHRVGLAIAVDIGCPMDGVTAIARGGDQHPAIVVESREAVAFPVDLYGIAQCLSARTECLDEGTLARQRSGLADLHRGREATSGFEIGAGKDYEHVASAQLIE